MTLVRFDDYHGNATLVNSESVAAMQDDYHAPGGRYEPGCTVFLNSGEKVRLPVSVADASRKLWPST